MTSEPVDFSRMNDDSYVAGLAPDQLWEIVQRWDDECSNRAGLLQRGPELSKEDFLTLTDVVMMIAESRALDSNAVVPIYTSVRDSGRDVLTTEDWEAGVLFTQRLEARFRWETAVQTPEPQIGLGRLNEMEQDILEALGAKRLKGEKVAKKAGYPFNSGFKGVLSGLVRRGVLRNDWEGKRIRGYYVNPACHHLIPGSGQGQD